MKVNSHAYTNNKNVITARYPGGYIGDYMLLVSHDTYGMLENSATFRVGARVSSVSPLRGSTAGGTLITVTGTDFDPLKSVIYFGYIPCATVGTPTST